jgi:hypothetical protein
MFTEQLKNAIESDDVDEYKRLVGMGADVHAQLWATDMALCYAITCNCLRVARFLIEYGVDVNEAEKSGLTPLMCAVRHERYDIIPALAAAGATVPTKASIPDAPLHELARMGRLAELRLLIDSGADPNCLNRDSATPLYWASMVGNVDSCRLLVSYGADPFFPQSGWIKYQNYLTPFQRAVETDSAEAVSYFIHECGADLGQRTVAGQSMLELAGGGGRVKALLLSLRSQAEVGEAFPSGETDELAASPVRQRQQMSL